MLVEGRNLEVFVVAVSKSSIFSISPVQDFVLFVKNDTEVSASRNPLDILTLQSLYFSRSGNCCRQIFPVARRPNSIHDQLQQEIHVLSSIAEGINLPFFGKSDSVALSADNIADTNIVLLEELDLLRSGEIFGVSVTQFAIAAAAEGIEVAE